MLVGAAIAWQLLLWNNFAAVVDAFSPSPSIHKLHFRNVLLSLHPRRCLYRSRSLLALEATKSSRSAREDEIRKKIIQLKKDGVIGNKKKKEEESSSSSAVTDKATAKVLNDLKNKGNSVAAKYEAKIKAKMAQRRNLDPDDDLDDAVAEEDKELEELVVQTLSKKRAAVQTAIEDGSLAKKAPVNATKSYGNDVEMHTPTSSGSWGVFPRPKSISKTFGGGKRVGVGFSDDGKDDDEKSVEETRARLQAYREKFGIDVQSEKDHAEEIEQAREVAKLMYSRGVYNNAAKTLEKVTPWCSSNSRVGGRVFLELGMAYEACGKTSEAITVYQTLSQSRMDDVKKDAKRLLYGIEAMEFMRNEVKAKNFQRQKIRDDYIDVSVLADVGGYDEKRYNTAYVDTENRNGWFYRMLTESVVRNTREARQILLSATYSECKIPRPRIVQALRSISREFDSELRKEMDEAAETTIFIDGKAINKKESNKVREPGTYYLASASQMMENLDGEWRLQLIADKSGDGVTFYNKTISWQQIDVQNMQYALFQPVGFTSIDSKGSWLFEDETRTLDREGASNDGGWISSVFGGSSTLLKPQQVMTADDEMCIMRLKTDVKLKNDDSNVKDYFSVWRKVDDGKYSGSNK